jgi:hypothetical protein
VPNAQFTWFNLKFLQILVCRLNLPFIPRFGSFQKFCFVIQAFWKDLKLFIAV